VFREIAVVRDRSLTQPPEQAASTSPVVTAVAAPRGADALAVKPFTTLDVNEADFGPEEDNLWNA
jgi:hypothetical protein